MIFLLAFCGTELISNDVLHEEIKHNFKNLMDVENW